MDSPAGKGLLERFHRALFGPPALFWVVVLLALAYSYPEVVVEAFYQALGLPVWSRVLMALAFAALLLFSAVMSDLARDDLYRWLEGYRWPVWALSWRTRTWEGRRKHMCDIWLGLEGTKRSLGPADIRRLSELDVELQHLPQAGSLLPTAFGNALRAAEEYVRSRYGLDPVVVWPRLWLLLSEERNELDGHRRALDAAVDGVFFSAILSFVGVFLFIIILIMLLINNILNISIIFPYKLTIFLLLVGPYFIWFFYRLAVKRAERFAVLLRAVFDVRRLHLYDALGCPRPQPTKEKEAGRRLTSFLWRGGWPPCPDEAESIARQEGETQIGKRGDSGHQHC